MMKNKDSCGFWLFVICSFQLILWSLSPWLTRGTLHKDTLEGLAWGNLWQWGYDKHPPLAPWLTAIFDHFSHASDLPIYVLAQLFIITAFLAVWRLAREYLNSYCALLAVFLLQGILFYSHQTIEVTPDTVQHALWPVLALTVYLAVTKNSLVYWLVAGITAGFAILAKYQAIVFFIPLAIALLCTREGRESLRSPYPWLGVLLALLISAPHFYWLYKHDFTSFFYFENTYVDSQTAQISSIWDHLKMPLKFIMNSLGSVFLVFILMIPLFRATKYSEHHTSFQRIFLIAIALGPTLLSLTFGLLTGDEIIPRWATPYFAWLPLLLLVWTKPVVDKQLFRKVVGWSLATGFLLLTLRCGYFVYKPEFRDDYWEDVEYSSLQEQMMKAEVLWAEYSNSPMPYLGGLHYHVAELVAHNRRKITPFLGLSPAESLWMKEEDFRKKGGIVVIKHDKRKTIEVRARLEQNYPDAVYLGTFKFKPKTKIQIDSHSGHMQTLDYFLIKPEQSAVVN